MRNISKRGKDGAIEIWAITDGRAGNEAQALGLAEAIGRRANGSVRVLRTPLRAWAARVPARLAAQVTQALGGWPEWIVERNADAPEPPWPDIVVGAGRRIAPLVAWIGNTPGTRSVQILAPQMPLRRFDHVVVPEHDRIRGSNVMTTLGAVNRMTPERVAAAGDAWHPPKLPGSEPVLAVMIGGPSKSAAFTTVDCNALAQAIGALDVSHQLLITASRRTPPKLIDQLRTNVGPDAFLWQDERDGPNPYPAMLQHAAAALITADSVNMASEAAATGKPVHIFPITRLAPKLTAFQSALQAYGASRPFHGRIDQWEYPALQEADRIAAMLVDPNTNSTQ